MHAQKYLKEELFTKLDTSENGLGNIEAATRLQNNGKNVIEKDKKKSPMRLLLAQFENWLMVSLLIAAGVSFFLGDKVDALVIIGLVFFSVILGFAQEYRAEKALEKLAEFISNNSKVKRDNEWVEIDSEKLVVGDVVELRIGDVVPADIRLFEIDGLTTNESALTGESAPILKTTDPVNGSEPQDLKNIAFMGTTISEGIGKGVVVATGTQTFFGQTASILGNEAPETEFQKQTQSFSKFLFKVIFVMSVFVFVVNSALHKGVLNSFLFAVALAVGITPELLPAIITITLSQGALKIAKKKVIVKKLISTEGLGNIDTLCTDKTGTLTKGEFTLAGYQNLQKKSDNNVLTKALICISGEVKGGHFIATNPIDRALWHSNEAKHNKSAVASYKLLDENEFDFTRRRISVLVHHDHETSLIVKGSIESIAPICTGGHDHQNHILDEAHELENQGFRVIGIGEKKLHKEKSTAADEKDIEFLGFLLFSDPIKESAIKALQKLKNLGVNIKILSGDSAIVTAHVAKNVGFDIDKEKIVTGDELTKLTVSQFEQIVKETTLFARVTPEQKYRIVLSLNKENHIVGYLGDGINDAPALKTADVGIAVDSGAMVAKEAADIILLRKDLEVLAEGIETGRKTYGNIMKYILNTISANYGNMITVSLSSLFLKFIPLLPSQILLNNFISDIPLFAVATDNVDGDFVRKPKRWNMGTIGSFMLYFGLISSLFDLLLILPMVYLWHTPAPLFRTAWFIESSLSEMVVTFAIRTKLPFYKSMPSTLLIALTIVSSGAVILLPMTLFGKTFFEFSSIPPFIWIWIACVVVTYFCAIEIAKHIFFSKFEL